MLTKFVIIFFLAFALALAGLAIASAEKKDDFSARIDVSKGPNGIIKIKPICRSKRSMIVTYSLNLKKQGKQGNSLSRQSGRATLTPNQTVALCLLSLNLPPNSSCRVQLEITHDGHVISQKEIFLTGSDKAGSI
jgi:hypothetical protein